MNRRNFVHSACWRGVAHAAIVIIATLTIAVALAEAAGARADAEKVDRLEIVDRAIAFHGGDRYRASETELDLCSRSGCFHVRALVDGDLFEYEVAGKVRDGEMRVLMTNIGGSETRIERWIDGEPAEVTAENRQALADWVMARVYFCFLPYRLNDPSVYKQDLGTVDWQGRKLHEVKVTFEPGSSTDAQDEYRYWFDPESGRLEQFAYSYDTSDQGLRFRRLFNERVVGGLRFFDQENYGVQGALAVEVIDPDFVAEKMPLLSTVKLENIEVRDLPRGSDRGRSTARSRR